MSDGYWNPSSVQDAVLTLICRQQPDREFVASQDPLTEDILLTIRGNLGGRRINADGTVDLLTEIQLQDAFGDSVDP